MPPAVGRMVRPAACLQGWHKLGRIGRKGQKMKRYTADDVRDILAAQMESDLPDKILAALAQHNGKKITTRILECLPVLPNGGTWRLIRHYGWTSLQSSTYGTDAGYAEKTSVDLILCRTESSVALDVDLVRKENPAYFAGRVERNAQRAAAMAGAPIICRTMADCLNAYGAAIDALQDARKWFDALTEYGNAFAADRYTLRDLVDPHEKATHKKGGTR